MHLYILYVNCIYVQDSAGQRVQLFDSQACGELVLAEVNKSG